MKTVTLQVLIGLQTFFHTKLSNGWKSKHFPPDSTQKGENSWSDYYYHVDQIPKKKIIFYVCELL